MAVSMWGPLLSMTHSARCAMAASVTSARDGWPVRAKLVEHLGRPDHRQVCRLAQPQDLLLHLGQAFVARLDGQVTPGDHDPDERGAHGVQEDLGKACEGRRGLDLQDQPEVLGPDSPEVACTSSTSRS